jgi:hypothetical protein
MRDVIFDSIRFDSPADPFILAPQAPTLDHKRGRCLAQTWSVLGGDLRLPARQRTCPIALSSRSLVVLFSSLGYIHATLGPVVMAATH